MSIESGRPPHVPAAATSLPDRSFRERKLSQLDGDLARLGADLDRLAALAQAPAGQDNTLSHQGCAPLAAELQSEHARLRLRLRRLGSATDDGRFEQLRMELERGEDRLRLVVQRLRARLFQD